MAGLVVRGATQLVSKVGVKLTNGSAAVAQEMTTASTVTAGAEEATVSARGVASTVNTGVQYALSTALHHPKEVKQVVDTTATLLSARLVASTSTTPEHESKTKQKTIVSYPNLSDASSSPSSYSSASSSLLPSEIQTSKRDKFQRVTFELTPESTSSNPPPPPTISKATTPNNKRHATKQNQAISSNQYDVIFYVDHGVLPVSDSLGSSPFLWRVLYILVAIGLLWLTSLAVCRRMIDSGMGSHGGVFTWEDSIRLVNESIQVVQTQSEEYETCATNVTQTCDMLTLQAQTNISANLNLTISLGQNVTKEFSQQTSSCTSWRLAIRQVLAYAAQSHNLLNAPYCVQSSKCASLVVDAQQAVAKASVQTALTQVVSAKQSSIENVQATDTLRASTTTNLLNEMVNRAIQAYTVYVNATLFIQSQAQTANQWIPDASPLMTASDATSGLLTQSLLDESNAYSQFADSNEAIYQTYVSSLPFSIASIVYPVLQSHQAVNFTYPTIPPFPVIPSIPTFNVTASVNQVKQAYLAYVNELKANLSTMYSLGNSNPAASNAALESFIVSTYVPPALPTNVTQTALETADHSYISQMQAILGLNDATNVDGYALSLLLQNLASINQSALFSAAAGVAASSSLAISNTIGTFLQLQQLNLVGSIGFNVTKVVATVEEVRSMTTMLDYAYRGIGMLFIISIYMDLANVQLPALDLRAKLETPYLSFADVASPLTPIQRVIGCSFCTAAMVGVTVLFAALALAVIHIYDPFYQDFLVNCAPVSSLAEYPSPATWSTLDAHRGSNGVLSEEESSTTNQVLLIQSLSQRNGTIFSGNLMPIGVVLSHSRGDAVFATYAAEASQSRNAWCSKESSRLFQSATLIQNNYQTVFNTFVSASDDLFILTTAFNLYEVNNLLTPLTISTVTNGFTDSIASTEAMQTIAETCQLDTSPIALPSFQFTCGSTTASPMENAAAEGVTLPSCNLACMSSSSSLVIDSNLGITSDDLVRSSVLVGSCAMELYVHSIFLRSMGVFALFLLLNISRFVLLVALRYLFAKWLSHGSQTVYETRFLLNKVDVPMRLSSSSSYSSTVGGAREPTSQRRRKARNNGYRRLPTTPEETMIERILQTRKNEIQLLADAVKLTRTLTDAGPASEAERALKSSFPANLLALQAKLKNRYHWHYIYHQRVGCMLLGVVLCLQGPWILFIATYRTAFVPVSEYWISSSVN